MTLLCNASGGNPDHYKYMWIFVPKYQGGNMTYHNQTSIENQSVNYKSAGTYVCTVSNAGGDAQTEKKVTIHCKTCVV